MARFRRKPRRALQARDDLTAGEIAILFAMTYRSWCTAEELGEVTGLVPFAIRAGLRQLVKHRLAIRSHNETNITEVTTWHLTGAGLLEANARRCGAGGILRGGYCDD